MNEDTDFISTGQLPARDAVGRVVDEVYRQCREGSEGEVSQVYPALAGVEPSLFGLCVVGTDGSAYAAGDSEHDFAIMSVSKPFVFALVCDQLGPKLLRARVGANATGLPFNSLAAVENSPDGRTNPMVNAGALATTSLVPGNSPEARWRFIHEGLSRFAGQDLALNVDVCDSAMKTNDRNQALTRLLHSLGRLGGAPGEVADLYTTQCALNVSARSLAVMGATLADGGVNPVTGERVVSESACHHTLAVMLTAGLYETSGDWLYDVGLPGKSGIGGGIVTVAPGKGAVATFAPPLDAVGNSVKGLRATQLLSQRLGLDLLASRPREAPVRLRAAGGRR